MTGLLIIEEILIVVDTLPEAFTVAMVRDALRTRGVIEGSRPDGFHIVYRVVRGREAAS